MEAFLNAVRKADVEAMKDIIRETSYGDPQLAIWIYVVLGNRSYFYNDFATVSIEPLRLHLSEIVQSMLERGTDLQTSVECLRTSEYRDALQKYYNALTVFPRRVDTLEYALILRLYTLMSYNDGNRDQWLAWKNVLTPFLGETLRPHLTEILAYAAEHNHLEKTAFLLNNTALDADITPKMLNIALHHRCQGISAALAQKIPMTDALAYINDVGNTLLILAAKVGHVGAAAALLERGVSAIVNTANRFGETALYWAARNGNPQMVKVLLKHGAVDSDRRAYQIAVEKQRTTVLAVFQFLHTFQAWRRHFLASLLNKTVLPKALCRCISEKCIG
jgi:hypothetical protein